jgi:hypothetical protein
VIRQVIRYVRTCDECGIDGPDLHRTRRDAENATCPCEDGDIIDKPPPINEAFRSCAEVGDPC